MAKRALRPIVAKMPAPLVPQKPAAKPVQAPRHRLAGSHDGLYVTEHHRSAAKK